jgi:DNA-binding CsgD family transcriptional regulator
VARAALLGRRQERTRLESLVDAVRAGQSGVLVVRGEPGIGKTALLQQLVDGASDLRTVRAVGVESEMELAFAGLHQLCVPLLDRLHTLPEPQRNALESVFGVREGVPPDRFLVGLATLSLLCEAADQRPVLCVVDDAQWLDRASTQTLAFVARRLLADPVALVFSTREATDDLAGLPEVVVGGLRDAEARTLLGSIPGAPLDAQVRERILRETRGNPLALLEWQRALTPAELAGGFPTPVTASLSGRIEQGFRRQLAQLPVATQRFLLVAAAEPVGDVGLVWSAARRLGVGDDDAAPAVEAGLVEVGANVRFRHPLVRSAAYQSASVTDQQHAHRALAEVTDLEVDPDRRAWHRARATRGPDDDVASELERAARRAQARGGLAAAGAFLERSVALTADPARRIRRALAAADAFQQSGRLEAAARLVAEAEAGAVDDLAHSEVALLRGRIAYASGDGAHAPRLLLQAAQRLETVDAARARQTYLMAIIFACFAGTFADGVDVEQIARSARAAPRAESSSVALDLLVDGLAALAIDGPSAAAPMLQRAIEVFRGPDLTPKPDLRWLGAACAAAGVVWDDERWHTLSSEQVATMRQAGALTVLSQSLNSLGHVFLLEGDLEAAASCIDEAEAINEISGSLWAPYAATYLAALRGQEVEATALAERTIKDATANGQGVACQFARSATATLWNGLGRYEDALAAAQEASEHPPDWSSHLSRHELVEAAVRCREMGLAKDALARLVESTAASGTEWALGVEARTRALIAEGDAADELYREAIERLSRTRIRTELARAHLLYGEWLRRDNRRLEARDHLRTAHEMLRLMGIAGFAERARRELQAAGETIRTRSTKSFEELTAQEACIARLVVDGLTNPEIGVQLYISARTVEYHLRKIFTKLGVTSRRELPGVLSTSERR